MTVVPGVLAASPLQPDEETDDAGDEKYSSDGIELPNDLLPAVGFEVLLSGRGEEENNAQNGYGANGEID